MKNKKEIQVIGEVLHPVIVGKKAQYRINNVWQRTGAVYRIIAADERHIKFETKNFRYEILFDDSTVNAVQPIALAA